ncbi:MAG: hypothetical protein E3J75_02840 [Dehalococcoidia bacterium]|nr:MAG: hypothetical protein E3J75_02840 [Dehalococcoidia bacterium]
MTQRVFILGAGSSAAFQGTKGSCPTISEFFIRAHEIGLIKRYREQTMSEPLFRFIQREFGISKPELCRVPVNIESVLTRLEEVIEDFDRDGQYRIKGNLRRNKKAVNLYGTRLQASTFIGHVLLELTHNALSPLHLKLAESLTNFDTVISFNYDLLMDYALENTGNWWPYSGYRIPFKQIIDGGKFLAPLSTSDPGIAYLKLHGSLNWLYGVSPYRLIYNMPVRNGEDVFLLRSINHEIIPGPMDIAGKHEYTDNNIYYDLHSLIVAPLKDKPYESIPKALFRLWDLASDEIKIASEVILIGYSIPESDTKSQELIKQAKTRRVAFTIVDKNPNPVVERLERLLAYKPSLVYHSFQDYINSIKV